MIWDWDYAREIFPDLAAASLVTLQVTLIGFALAMVLGLVWAVIGLVRIPVLGFMVRLMVQFLRSTPLLIQLFAAYYFLPAWGIFLPAMTTGILVIGFHYSAYCAEVYRAGLNDVPRGQWEAARAINLGQLATLRRIILPQAVPPIILPLGNYFVAMFKETPVLLAITVIELVATARIIGNDTFRYTEPISMAGMFFLIFSLIGARAVRYASDRAMPAERRRV